MSANVEQTFVEQRRTVCQLAAEFAARGWLPATSGNLSVKVSDSPLLIAITRSGADKQHLQESDVIVVNGSNETVEDTPYRPSAETMVHTNLYARFGCGAVLHVHTTYNNLASDLYFEEGFVELTGYELLKALDHWEEHARIRVPIVENFHDLRRLGEAVAAAASEDVPGVLVRNHGIYAWGRTPMEAKRHLEALEWLFEYHLLRQQFAAVPYKKKVVPS
jgi:methylthioribulose-1-phosphate dehydratase